MAKVYIPGTYFLPVPGILLPGTWYKHDDVLYWWPDFTTSDSSYAEYFLVSYMARMSCQYYLLWINYHWMGQHRIVHINCVPPRPNYWVCPGTHLSPTFLYTILDDLAGHIPAPYITRFVVRSDELQNSIWLIRHWGGEAHSNPSKFLSPWLSYEYVPPLTIRST